MIAPRLCAVPGCAQALYERNTTGVCRSHNHAPGHCECIQCAGHTRRRNRPRAQDEMVESGLLPQRRPGRREPGIPRPPWEDTADA